MKTVKKLLSVVLCLAMLASCALIALPAMAADGDTATPWVKTTVNPDGTVELVRDAKAGNAWPRIRNIMGVESAPAIDLTTTNTLYYDFEVTGCKWMLQLSFTGVDVKLAKSITAAAGGTALKNTDEDGAAGSYKGSLNIMDAVKTIAADSSDPNAAAAQTIANMPKSIVPTVTFYVVDSTTSGKIKLNSLYMSSASDTTGANCKQMSIGLLYPDEESDTPIPGVKYFPLDMNNGAGGYDDAWEVEAGDNFYQRWNEAEAAATATKAESSESETTKKDTAATTKKDTAATTKKADANTNNNTMIIIIAVVAVVVVAAVVVAIVLVQKKKKGGNGGNGDDTTPPSAQ